MTTQEFIRSIPVWIWIALLIGFISIIDNAIYLIKKGIKNNGNN